MVLQTRVAAQLHPVGVSGQIKWTEMAPINGTGEKQKEARGGPLEKKDGQVI